MPQLETAIVGKNNTKAGVTGQNELLVKVNSVSPGTGLATESTLQNVETNTSAKTRSAVVERTSTSGSNTDDIFSISFSNVGAANGIVQGAQLKPGETINFDASSLNNFFKIGEFAWDATGTEFLIIYVIGS